MRFLELLGEKVYGVLAGLDRIRFRGTLRCLANSAGINRFTGSVGVLLKDFGAFAEERTRVVRAACEAHANAQGTPIHYLRSSRVDKEALARSIAAARGVRNGPICLFSVVEPCMAPCVRGNRQTKELELEMVERKCIYLYGYFDHPQVGFGHVRLQTWLPFTVNICLNGRHWLEKQLLAQGMTFAKDGNCLRWVNDPSLAQKLFDTQLSTDWSGLLDGLLREMLPSINKAFAPVRPTYYWSADETEYATDLMFRSADELDALFPVLVRHAMLVSDSPSVMRFLGRCDQRGSLPEDVSSDSRRRYEGVRVKHWANRNSVKMYNKAGSVLRIETTINDPRPFKAYRTPENRPADPPAWLRMRKGVADLHRRCEVSARCNAVYADALAAARIGEQLQSVTSPVCRSVRKDGRRARALNPLAEGDRAMLRFLADGTYAIAGFRNKDLAAALCGSVPSDPTERKRRCGVATRRIRLLRAHGLVHKIPHENRYMVTEKGQKLAAAISAAANVTVQQLVDMAA